MIDNTICKIITTNCVRRENIMKDIGDILKKEMVYKIKNMDKVQIQKGIIFNSDEKEIMSMDLYKAYDNDKERIPAVILIHGESSSVNFKECGEYISAGKLIGASGLNAITFNHKTLSDGCNVEEVISSIDDLLKYVIENAAELKIDENKIAIWCFSGGVPFGLYEGMHDYFDNIKAIAAYYGFGELKSVEELLGRKIGEEVIEKYSPINLIMKNADKIPPLFLARAGLDRPVLKKSIEMFIEKGFEYNLAMDIYNHPTGVHGFDLFTDNERTHEIIKKTLEFLKYHLR